MHSFHSPAYRYVYSFFRIPKFSKRRHPNALEKYDLLCAYDKIPKLSSRYAGNQLNVSHTAYLLSRILKDRANMERLSLKNVCLTRKRRRTGKEELAEVALKGYGFRKSWRKGCWRACSGNMIL